MAEDALDGSNMVDKLPFDVWVAIVSHLPVQSIVNLSHVSDIQTFLRTAYVPYNKFRLANICPAS